jgi:hypothetical protein
MGTPICSTLQDYNLSSIFRCFFLTSMLPGFLCIPYTGAHFLQGRFWRSDGTAVSLLAVDQLVQHACLSPVDGSFVLMDAALLDYAQKREAFIVGVDKTGGSLCNLGVSAGVGAPLTFLPRVCYCDDRASVLAKNFFPDLSIQPTVLVIEGDFDLSLHPEAWQPMPLSETGAQCHGRAVTELLQRTWEDDSSAATDAVECSHTGLSAPTRSVAADPDPEGGWIDTRVLASGTRRPADSAGCM